MAAKLLNKFNFVLIFALLFLISWIKISMAQPSACKVKSTEQQKLQCLISAARAEIESSLSPIITKKHCAHQEMWRETMLEKRGYFYRPVLPRSYFQIGSTGTNNNEIRYCNTIVKLNPSLRSKIDNHLVRPKGWKMVWATKWLESSEGKGSLWSAIPPNNTFVCLGHVAQKGYQAPNAPRYRCINKRHLNQVTNDFVLWTNEGGEADNEDQNITIFKLIRSGLLVSVRGSHKRHDWYALKPEIFRKPDPLIIEKLLETRITRIKENIRIERQRQQRARALQVQKRKELAKKRALRNERRRKEAAKALKRQKERERKAAKLRKERERKAAQLRSKRYAKYLLSDVKIFAKENPGELDTLALGSLYAPAIKELSSGKFRDPKSNFLNLVTFVKRSEVFQAYHSTKMAERNKQLEAQRQERNKRISAQRNELKNTIKETILRIKTRINADPFSEDAAILSQIFKKYQRTPHGISLSQLRERVKALSIKLDKYGITVIAQPAPGSTIPATSKTKTSHGNIHLKQLSDMKNEDVTFLVNFGVGNKNSLMDLSGKATFEKRTINLCAPAFSSSNNKLKIYLLNQLNQKLPNHILVIKKRCIRGFKDVDAIFASGSDFAKGTSVPDTSELNKRFKTKKLIRLFTIKKAEFARELIKREILSSQYKNDIESGIRKGFAALSFKNSSDLACGVELNKIEHQISIEKAKKFHQFNSGVMSKEFISVSAAEAFRQAQRGKCGFIYGDASTLKIIIKASKKAELKLNVLPFWTTTEEIALRKENLTKQNQGQAQAERNRRAKLRAQAIERRRALSAKAAKLSERQRQYRAKYNAKVVSLVAYINDRVQKVRSPWTTIDSWRRDQTNKGWEFTSTAPLPLDYGFANWRGRKLETILANITFNKKHPDLGEYENVCWTLGYLNDTEFNRIRDLIAVSCANKTEIDKWKVERGFQTRWLLVK